jgi:hypothetical protein
MGAGDDDGTAKKWADTGEERKHPTAWRQQVFARVHVLCGQLALLDRSKAADAALKSA